MTNINIYSIYDEQIIIQKRDCENIIRFLILEKKYFKMNAIKT